MDINLLAELLLVKDIIFASYNKGDTKTKKRLKTI